MPSPPSKLASFLVTAGLFFSGPVLGVATAMAAAPDSSIASILSFLMLPLALFCGFWGWLGLAFWSALWGLITRRKRPGKADGTATEIPPGSVAFVPVSVLLALAVGLVVAFFPGGLGFLATLALYLGVGAAYGIVCWRAARAGLLPFPDSE